MSWSKNVSGCPVGDVGAKLRALPNCYGGAETPEAAEQIEAATLAVESLLKVVQPDPAGVVNVMISGHANTDHQKDPAYMNDAVYVNIYQQ